VPDRVFVAHADCAKIIGRKGETRMDIERQSEASVKIMREEDMDPAKKERWVDFIGNPRQRRAALKMIIDIASFVRDESGKVLKDGSSAPASGESLVLIISCNEVGRILGRGGETIRRMEDDSRARIEIDKGEGRLTVSGRPEAMARAREMILAEVSHCKSADGTILKDENNPLRSGTGGAPMPGGKSSGDGGSSPFKVWVLGKEAGKVIGRGGETVREIMQRTGADINVERSENRDAGHAERLIQIHGTKTQIEEAFPMIVKDVTFARTEFGVAKSEGMQPHEADEALRMRGPGGSAAPLAPMMPWLPGGPPPGPWGPGGPLPPGTTMPLGHPGMMPPGLPPPGMMGTMPPGMFPPGMPHPGTMPGMPHPGSMPGMMPGMPPPGMMPFPPMPSNGMTHPGMPPFPMPGMLPGMPGCGGKGFGGPPPAQGRGRSRSRSKSSSSSSGGGTKKAKKKREFTDHVFAKSGGGPPPEAWIPAAPYFPPTAPSFPDKPIEWDDL